MKRYRWVIFAPEVGLEAVAAGYAGTLAEAKGACNEQRAALRKGLGYEGKVYDPDDTGAVWKLKVESRRWFRLEWKRRAP